MRSIPKVVGGYDEPSLALADALYCTGFSAIHKVSSCRVAEASKIVENVYRCVNIALVNELKMIFDKMDIDIWEVRCLTLPSLHYCNILDRYRV
jgi:UDP-N-acetyl-D-glucosamine dehydrogenase